MTLSASFLSVKDNLKQNIVKLDKSTIDYLHIDIMDGEFVSDKTWSIEEIKKLTENVSKPLDVHLMVTDVFKYIDEYKNLNPQFITFHLEAIENPVNVIEYIKSLDIKVGISIKPNTPVELLQPYLSLLDLVLVMSVEPGRGGQSFISNSENKINDLFSIRKNNNYNYLIEVDGGINDETVNYCNKADILVVGSFITNENNYQEQINKLYKN